MWNRLSPASQWGADKDPREVGGWGAGEGPRGHPSGWCFQGQVVCTPNSCLSQRFRGSKQPQTPNTPVAISWESKAPWDCHTVSLATVIRNTPPPSPSQSLSLWPWDPASIRMAPASAVGVQLTWGQCWAGSTCLCCHPTAGHGPTWLVTWCSAPLTVLQLRQPC